MNNNKPCVHVGIVLSNGKVSVWRETDRDFDDVLHEYLSDFDPFQKMARVELANVPYHLRENERKTQFIGAEVW